MSGYDWTDRYPLIAAAAATLKSSMIINAEAVIQGPDGVTDFEALLSKAIVGRGPEVYQAASHMGLEGIVSKRIDAPYRSGKSSAWSKIKNPNAPGVIRFRETLE